MASHVQLIAAKAGRLKMKEGLCSFGGSHESVTQNMPAFEKEPGRSKTTFKTNIYLFIVFSLQ